MTIFNLNTKCYTKCLLLSELNYKILFKMHLGTLWVFVCFCLVFPLFNMIIYLFSLMLLLQASDSPQKSKKQASRNSEGSEKLSGAKRCKKACATGEGSENDTASTSASNTPKKGGKEAKKKKLEDNPCTNATMQDFVQPIKQTKMTRDNSKDLEICRYSTIICVNTHRWHISSTVCINTNKYKALFIL